MGHKQILFCGNHPHYLKKELIKDSNEANGGIAFRIPSIINAGDGVLVAAIDRASTGADWGYIEIAIRRSENGGKTWSNVEAIAIPPARETKISDDCYSSGFFIDPCMAIAPNGDIVMIIDFWPECKGLHNRSILDKKKAPYGELNGKNCLLIYDRNGSRFFVHDDGKVFDSKKNPTDYRVEGLGSLYEKDEYLGNIYLNGPVGVNEANAKTTSGAPLKAPNRCYVFMLRSSDKGKTWTEPKDITNMFLGKSDGTFLGVAPGVGLTTKKGRIIMPLYVDRKETVAVYSDDNGETWKRSDTQPYSKNTDEWQLIEVSDGRILGFGRQKKYGKTPVSISYNNGENWIKGKKTGVLAPKCQKSVITFGEYVLCSHAGLGSKKRENGALSVGKLADTKKGYTAVEWINHKKINNGFFAYSCLVPIDEETVGILYEAEPSSYLIFETYKIDELVK